MATISSSADRRGLHHGLAPRGSDVPWTPPAVTPAQREVDLQLIAVLDAPLAPGETAMAGYKRKELGLIAVLAKLAPVDANALHFRLANPRAADDVAQRFLRLAVDRRVRLLAFIADTRRRLATAGRAGR